METLNPVEMVIRAVKAATDAAIQNDTCVNFDLMAALNKDVGVLYSSGHIHHRPSLPLSAERTLEDFLKVYKELSSTGDVANAMVAHFGMHPRFSVKVPDLDDLREVQHLIDSGWHFFKEEAADGDSRPALLFYSETIDGYLIPANYELIARSELRGATSSTVH